MDSPIIFGLFEGWHPDTASGRPIFLQLSEKIMQLIKDGQLSHRQKLPSTRLLAAQLNINRLTVGKAYDELSLQGWLDAKVGSGTFVSADTTTGQGIDWSGGQESSAVTGTDVPIHKYISVPHVTEHHGLHLDDGFPDPRITPLKEFQRCCHNQLNRSGLYEKFGRYTPPQGSAYYRETLSKYLHETRALPTSEEQILSVSGTVMALHLIAQTLLRPNDVVALGIPTWGRAEQNFRHAGANVRGISVDEQGIIVEEFEQLLQNCPIKMLYLTPHHHYPTTVTLSLDRRLRLLELAHRYGFWIVEDDYDFDFHFALRPILPLASADRHGHVIYCGSFSKSLSPAFRNGYVVASDKVIYELAKLRSIVDRQGNPVIDHAFADLIEDGTMQRFHRKALTIYRKRRDFLCEMLDSEFSGLVQYNKPQGGLAVWTQFDAAFPVDEIAAKAFVKGLYISDGRAHRYPGYAQNAIRLGFASCTEEEIAASLRMLKSVM
ncbi:PLP-dependent aminotransferase family protein [Sphingobacterium alkalisoli]|uniref:PLP-dependent aminotransferase family protein n=1 Tax=Sphingobacterium alkalisoli TaxID=1874115 RepID=A0A4U0GUE1_9SPHI|nr:PLP-dependent aminotransferase family protein [Sphingobacterium alkalisoli]TJY62588.1 PLP-dependent aminotransferase family protein [Sphingobacterium alkalisoli]GGH27625.1 GntR family transcriptional regulator [Sphingobacterium alkalisoli]